MCASGTVAVDATGAHNSIVQTSAMTSLSACPLMTSNATGTYADYAPIVMSFKVPNFYLNLLMLSSNEL